MGEPIIYYIFFKTHAFGTRLFLDWRVLFLKNLSQFGKKIGEKILLHLEDIGDTENTQISILEILSPTKTF